jgi:hypothetical protein
MRLFRLTLLALLIVGPTLASARAWKGMNPGATNQAEVVQRFGEPTTRTKRGARTILAYYGDQALDGTKQTQFHVDAAGTVQEITVFLTAQLDAETIEGTYGKPPQKTFVEDTFQKVWLYPQQGVTVYFGKEGGVDALSFAPGTKGQRAAAAAEVDKAPAEKTAAAPAR